MADVFISYSKRDVTDARMLAALLEANGYTVWWDPHLMCGDRFREEIAEELGKARAVIAIWTKSSVASEWVQSEAGRAHRNQKLLPVRSSELEYDEIPPPFENVHTLRLNQTEQILAAVAGQLAKPAAAGPRWKVLRYEVLTWLGMIGGAITLTTNTSGFFKLSAAFSWVLHNWSGLLKYFWQALLLFKVEVSPYDAEFLTIGLLMTSAIFYSSRQPNSAVQKSLTTTRQESIGDQLFDAVPSFLALCWALSIIFGVMAMGAVEVGKREVEKDQKTWESVAARLFVDRKECAVAVKKAEVLKFKTRDDYPEKDRVEKEVDDCFKSTPKTGLNEKERALAQRYPPPIGFGNGSLWVDFVFSAPSDVSFWIFGMVAVLSPIFLPFVLYRLAKSIYPLKLRLPVLADRLWRTLIAFGTIVIVNLIVLNVEGWLKAIPLEL